LEKKAMRAIFDFRMMRIVLVTVICLFVFHSQVAGFAGGTGTPDDPYQIATAEQLVSIGSNANLLDKHFVLVNDIDLDPNLPGGQVFTRAVIAPDIDSAGGFQGTAFTGSFDGNCHKIKNLHIHAVTAGYLGLFGCIEKGGCIRNLGLEDVSISGLWNIGGLAGYSDATINNCYVTGSISGGYDCGYVGGLIGSQDWNGVIINCYTSGSVSIGGQGGSIGGLVGYNYDGIIVDCRTDVDVSCGNSSISLGGLVGQHMGTIMNCYSYGDVSGGDNSQNIGGLVGVFGDLWMDDIVIPLGKITNSCATGNVSAGSESSHLGGLVGNSRLTILANCYAAGSVTAGQGSSELHGLIGGGALMVANSFWDTETSGLVNSEGGTGLTTAQMQDIQTFLNAGWDFTGERENGMAELWSMPEGGRYPVPSIFSSDFQRRTLSGSGTPEDPYQIATAEDLGAINHYDLNACYKLVADIDLAGITWSLAPVLFLDGKFDGSGHTISNLTIRGGYDLALFGILGADASVTDLGVTDVNINGTIESGVNLASLAGWSMGEIARCYATGSVSGGNEARRVGGLVGGLYQGTIDDCYSMVTVSACVDSGGVGGFVGLSSGSITNSFAAGSVTGGNLSTSFGGLLGSNRGGIVTKSYSSGNVSCGERSRFVGGFVGLNVGTVENCYANSNVAAGDSSSRLGGLIGQSEVTSSMVNRCYATGSVSCQSNGDYLGGLVGYIWREQVTNSYFLAPSNGGGPDNDIGSPLMDIQMKRRSSFTGWDFNDIWMICEGVDYPRLQWQNIQCGQ
jgi:hypothetical protein